MPESDALPGGRAEQSRLSLSEVARLGGAVAISGVIYTAIKIAQRFQSVKSVGPSTDSSEGQAWRTLELTGDAFEPKTDLAETEQKSA